MTESRIRFEWPDGDDRTAEEMRPTVVAWFEQAGVAEDQITYDGVVASNGQQVKRWSAPRPEGGL